MYKLTTTPNYARLADSPNGPSPGSNSTGPHNPVDGPPQGALSMADLRGTVAGSAFLLQEEHHSPSEKSAVANDILYGAAAIASFLFGEDTIKNRRRVFYLASRRLPVFRMGGSRLCCRRSTLLQFIAAQEQRNRIARPHNG